LGQRVSHCANAIAQINCNIRSEHVFVSSLLPRSG
jgi:hypothetical protein